MKKQKRPSVIHKSTTDTGMKKQKRPSVIHKSTTDTGMKIK